ncbi:hypothetical protein [Amycolatopsis sp. NPDC057786]|uniref:hypothetical protein n=1 Tax=Amycolatopsis sp. NPDC057786 TaxID=3346250 RepID=UPI0036720FB9
MAPTASLRSRALTELLYLDAAKPSGTPALESVGDNGEWRARRLRGHAARLRKIAGEHLELAAESAAAGDLLLAQRQRDLAERASCHYMAYDELAMAAERRGRARRFVRGSTVWEIEVCLALAAIRRAEGHRERGEVVLHRGDTSASARHRHFAEEAEETARIAELRAAELLEAQAGASQGVP